MSVRQAFGIQQGARLLESLLFSVQITLDLLTLSVFRPGIPPLSPAANAGGSRTRRSYAAGGPPTVIGSLVNESWEKGGGTRLYRKTWHTEPPEVIAEVRIFIASS